MPVEPRTVLLDTHALVWWRADRERLSASAASLLDGTTVLLVSPMTFWEVGMLVEKGRIALDRPTLTWTADVVRHDRVELAEITPQIAVGAAELPDFHGDPADRLLFATARARRVPFVTKDRKIHDYVESRPGIDVRW